MTGRRGRSGDELRRGEIPGPNRRWIACYLIGNIVCPSEFGESYAACDIYVLLSFHFSEDDLMVYISESEKQRRLAEIREFCDAHNIRYSKSQDSYYFTIRGVRYRVSNHTVEASNRAAFRRDGSQRRALYHPGGREKDTVYIHASHFRIPQIYMDLRMGRKLDGRGRGKPRERVLRCRRKMGR